MPSSRSASLLATLGTIVSLPTPGIAWGCITEAEIIGSQKAWAKGLVDIGNAFVGDMSTTGKNAMNCTGAKAVAETVISRVYAYDAGQTVLFKPTLSAKPATFRPTRDGALSYFIGPCAPDTKADFPNDGGFALGYSAAPHGRNEKDMREYQGFKEAEFHNMTFLTGGPYCKSAVAMGKLTVTSRLTGKTATVDKSWVYVKPPRKRKTATAPLLVTLHHSSVEVSPPSPSSAALTAIASLPTTRAECITEADIIVAQAAWANGLIDVGDAFIGDMETTGKNAMNCTSAKVVAETALSAVYAYDAGMHVLFKPTLSVQPETFRPTRDGALSYFIGPCAPDEQANFPNDGGFALGYSAAPNGRNEQNMSEYEGFKQAEFHNMTFLTSEYSGDPYCQSAVAMGKLTVTSRLTGKTTTVDKSFVYIKPPKGQSPDGSPLLLTLHHSSVEVSPGPPWPPSPSLLPTRGVAKAILLVVIFAILLTIGIVLWRRRRGAVAAPEGGERLTEVAAVVG